MAQFRIPARPNGRGNFDVRVELEGAEYRFRFRWNSRDQGWYVSLLDSEDAEILMGQKVVPNADLTLRATLDNAFKGRLYAIDSRFPEALAGFDELGDVVPVIYDESPSDG